MFTRRFLLNTVILHHGTNDLKSKSTSKQIADNIIRLAIFVKSDGNRVIVSGLTIRTDKLNDEVNKVRSSPPGVFLGKGVLKICSKFIGEHPYYLPIIYMRTPMHIFRTPSFKNTSGELLLQTE